MEMGCSRLAARSSGWPRVDLRFSTFHRGVWNIVLCGDDFAAHEGNEQRRAAVFAELRRAESVFAELTFQSLPGPSTTYQDLPWASRKPGRRGPGTEDNPKLFYCSWPPRAPHTQSIVLNFPGS